MANDRSMADTEQAQPRAVIADDDPFARRVIKDVLQRSGVIVIAEARDGHQAVELTLRHLPDVVVMDVVMPGFDGVVATRRMPSSRRHRGAGDARRGPSPARAA